MSILKKIKKIKQKEIIALKEKVSLNDRKEILRDLPETRDFETSILEKNNSSYTLITEIKKSPLTVKLAMGILFGKIKNSHDLFFASCETKAHLNYLFNSDKILIDKNERAYKYIYNYRHYK